MSATAMTPPAQRTLWRRLLLDHNLFTASILGVGGWWLGYFIGLQIHGQSLAYYSTEAGQNDVAIFLGYFLGVIAFLVGMGFANYPINRLLGRPASLAERESEEHGLLRYFSLSTDHKVVAKQYFVGVGLGFGVGGVLAMLIRTELLQPNTHVFGANQYLTLVGMHGALMMGTMTSGVMGPFASWLVPIMIGARRMAFPRLEAFSFWLLAAAEVIMLTTVLFGGFQTGWTGYQPLGDQGTAGYDAYIGFFALVGISMTAFGLNLVCTIIAMRAPGMTWSRLPIFVWASLATGALMLLAAPMLIATLLMAAMDRTLQTAFFIPGQGGSPYLFENLFWVFGHPEVYILALPGFGIVLELLPVFARKPLWGYRLAVAGVLGVALLSFFVWQHHLFVSGMNADLRPFFMFSTEMISLPTGLIMLCALGTLWRGRLRFTVPMLFCLAWGWNFLWGGVSGVFASDAPSDVTTHGSFFILAHFHYTIMGGLIFTFFAGIYYWVPKIYGYKFNERLAKIHFWVMFLAFNSTFAPLFAVGFLGMPRRVVTYPAGLQGLNDWSTISAYVLGLSLLLFLFNAVWSLAFKREPAEPNPWHAKSIEWQLPTPVPVHDFDRIPRFGPDPYPYGEPVPAAVPAGAGAAEE